VALVVAGILLLEARPGPTARRPPAPPPPSPRQLYSPFTGEPVSSYKPVLAVKIDNVVQARPPTGLTDADIVYVIPVEGGLSRLMAVISSHVPPVIGPVRSSREDDLELLRQFGTPAFAYSGATSRLLPVVEHARTKDLYAGRAGGYFRSDSREIPHNLYAKTPQLLAGARGASVARDIGFRFGPAPAGGRPATARSVGYPAASFTFRWSASRSRWLVWMDGSKAGTTEGGQLGAATVVIQYTKVRTSRYLEQGVRPPYAVSTGSGSAVVLRDGKVMIVGGIDSDGGPTDTTFLYDPTRNVWEYGPRMTQPRFQQATVMLASGDVLMIGGDGLAAGTSELYLASEKRFVASGPLAVPRLVAQAAALPDGRVVVTGGLPLHMTTYAPLGSVEVWDPATGLWTESAPLSEGRAWGVLLRVDHALYLVSGNGADETAFRTVERLTVD
jgi:hypothetical protein